MNIKTLKMKIMNGKTATKDHGKHFILVLHEISAVFSKM
jgi:hypothetical protein